MHGTGWVNTFPNQSVPNSLYLKIPFFQLFHDGGRCHIEISPLICSGFYMITASVMKEFKTHVNWNLTADNKKLEVL